MCVLEYFTFFHVDELVFHAHKTLQKETRTTNG